MAKVLCGISNIPFKCDHIPMTLSNREYTHPIFYLPQKKLLGIYSLYIKGELTDIDSYLLFLALLQSTESIQWVVPAEITSSTPSIIASNIGQLVKVIWDTNAITHPRFKQPKFFVRKDTANLDNIKVWIAAWNKNIDNFKSDTYDAKALETLKVVENKLSKLIFSPETSNIQLSSAVADWASKAAKFPSSKKDQWKLIIRKCYNLEAMFSTPKEELIALKEYCEENLEAGSIHFHTLMKTLRVGISNHNDFLSLGSLDAYSPASGYTLLTTDNTREEAALVSLADSAPLDAPIASEYPNKLAFLKAKLAYKQAVKMGKRDTAPNIPNLSIPNLGEI